MNTFKVWRSFATIMVGAICAGVVVLGSAKSATPRDAVWLSEKGANTSVQTHGTSEMEVLEDAVWL